LATADETLTEIKSRGHWRINCRPTVYPNEKLSLTDAELYVRSHQVSLRGWNYPFAPHRNDEEQGLLPAGDFCHAFVNWQNHKEYWRMYRSSQFLHFLALREDWFAVSLNATRQVREIQPGRVIGVVGLIYQITEIFEFFARLCRAQLYRGSVQIFIELNNTKGRELWLDDPRRVPFLETKKTDAQTIKIERNLEHTELANNSADIALKAIVEILDNFGWSNVPLESLKIDQEKFLKRVFD
jgi:hypothetical protein